MELIIILAVQFGILGLMAYGLREKRTHFRLPSRKKGRWHGVARSRALLRVR